MSLLNNLKSLYITRTKFYRKLHNRSLPFADNIIDRWEKAKMLGFGKGSSVYDNCLILGSVFVGENSWIGPNTILDGSGGTLEIGSNCSISAGTQIYTHDTVRRNISGGDADIEMNGTTIGDNCYIGPNCTISKGVVIGDRVIVGANSLVLKSIPSDMIAYGTPAKIMGSSEEYLKRHDINN